MHTLVKLQCASLVMKFVLSFLVFSVAIAAVIATSDEELWKEFKSQHGRQYRSLLEEKHRFSIFKYNLRKIETHNKRYDEGLETYYMGINRFSDWTEKEFNDFVNLHPKPAKNPNSMLYNETRETRAAPDSIDWRNRGCVTKVKDQGECRACWSFSATGSLEGQVARATGKLVSLSEQELIDCSSVYHNEGCNGGAMQYAFAYVVTHGLASEASYPYKATDGICRKGLTRALKSIQGYYEIKHNETSLRVAVGTMGPVSVGVNANPNFHRYTGGIFKDSSCDPKKLNHGVLIVGYGSENGQDYWLVKNSWGESFGEKGYIRMARGVNQCGIASDATFPFL